MTLYIIIAITVSALSAAFMGILGYKLALALCGLARNRRIGQGRAQAMAILAERFARGEIDPGEYAERRAVLEA